ncbi:expressed unknown protein [Seminavis robusta]|uniref:Sulfotransferase n=1 Tax=Seminavis robusta TaxID=568900 RepID=A0A9N8DR00_9STRA|nr:expressed unknown protein [Seminavis robusta]|eukprot:Sro309_g113680.1 n/a (393) ;mRNA; f:4178-5637
MVAVASPKLRKEQESKELKIFVVTVTGILLVLAGLFFGLSLGKRRQGSRSSGQGFKLLPTPSKTAREEWPPLSAVYDGQKVISDPQFLLDFAIIGFEKSGSSTFMQWLGAHPQVQCFQEEIYDLYQNKTGAMVWRLHTQLKPGFEYKRGYKSPGDIFLANTIHLLDEYFPKTRLILSLRHPILYYQSIYNFRIQNLPNPDDPFHTPLEGIGECKNTYPGYVCTNHANYAQYIYRLGKTLSRFPTETEQAIIDEKPRSAAKARVTRNLIFVVEISQLKDDNALRRQQLKEDLRDFLGLDSDLPDEIPKVVPGKKWPADVQAIKDKRKMNICEDQYIPLREDIMRVSKQTATWILESFIQSDDVFVSTPEFFEQSIKKWMEDPCETKTLRAASK